MAPETLGEVPDSAPVNSDVQPGATLEARPKIRRWISVLTIVLVVVVAAMTAALTYVTGQLNTAKADLAAANSDLISVRSQLSTVTANLDKTRNQEELDEKVFNLKLQVKAGVDLKDRTTLGELIKLWFETEVVPGVKENTAAIIRSNINTHLLPLCSGYVAKDVTPSQVKLSQRDREVEQVRRQKLFPRVEGSLSARGRKRVVASIPRSVTLQIRRAPRGKA